MEAVEGKGHSFFDDAYTGCTGHSLDEKRVTLSFNGFHRQNILTESL
jgi:hypothetical protein